MNSGAALYIAKPELTMEQAISLAEQTIDNGNAMVQLEKFIQFSNEVIA